MSNPMYMTTDEFVRGVLAAAGECGYGWLNMGTHHPEDIATNLGPVMVAYAAGMTDAIRRVAQEQRDAAEHAAELEFASLHEEGLA